MMTPRARGWSLVRVFLAIVVLALATTTTGARALDRDDSIETRGPSREKCAEKSAMIDKLKEELLRLRRELSMAEKRGKDAMECDARLRTEVGMRKMAQEEAARCEEALERERRRTNAADVAKTMASDGLARAKQFARNARPIIEAGVRNAAPKVKEATEVAKKRYVQEIKRVQKKLSPVRRKMKAKMKTIDALAPYATDHHINFAFQAIYTLFMALVVQRVLGFVLGALFRPRRRPVPRHIRRNSVELRPLSPER